MNLIQLPVGDDAPAVVNVVIENPKGSRLKVEYNAEHGYFFLDRIHQTFLGSPTDYGFIPSTLDEDNDALDILLVTDDPLPTGMVAEMRVLGVMYMNDSGEVDNKLVGVIKSDKTKDHIKTLDDLGDQFKKAVQHYFEHYKDLKGDTVEISGWGDIDAATEVLNECIQRYKET